MILKMLLTNIRAEGDHRLLLVFENGSELSVPVGIVQEFDLYAGRELSTEELKLLKKRTRAAGAKEQAARMVAARPLSEKLLVKKLIEKGQDPEDAEDAAAWLEELGAINDGEYAAMLVRHLSAKGYGPARIKNELYQKGVDRELWSDALEQMPDMEDVLDSFIKSRLKGGLGDRKQIKKVTDALYRRGFGWDDIRSALNRYEEGIEDYLED